MSKTSKQSSKSSWRESKDSKLISTNKSNPEHCCFNWNKLLCKLYIFVFYCFEGSVYYPDHSSTVSTDATDNTYPRIRSKAKHLILTLTLTPQWKAKLIINKIHVPHCSVKQTTNEEMQLLVVFFLVLVLELSSKNKSLSASSDDVKKGLDCYECDGPSNLCSCESLMVSISRLSLFVQTTTRSTRSRVTPMWPPAASGASRRSTPTRWDLTVQKSSWWMPKGMKLPVPLNIKKNFLRERWKIIHTYLQNIFSF